jgi:hypothetical protein
MAEDWRAGWRACAAQNVVLTSRAAVSAMASQALRALTCGGVRGSISDSIPA